MLDILKHIESVIKDARLGHSMTHEQFADFVKQKTGWQIDPSKLGEFEAGQFDDIDMIEIELLCKALGYKVSSIMKVAESRQDQAK